ncbi:lipopolysaccharide biosynthesis protein [Desulfobacterota bacterium AH_259_B03_O07]|nr:lipopolysaccharide biosynthesis protein [Desulfobacterota bacterium AH_259_B03_O07]
MYIQNIRKILNSLVKQDNSLASRVAVGGFWVFALRMVQLALNLIRLVVLARILVPKDFGLMGIALLTMATFETFSQTGFRQALIQKKGVIEGYLDSAWTLLVVRGFILFAILFFIAPYAAEFFKAPDTKLIVQVVGLSILIQSFTNIGVVYFQKELEFNKQFIYELSGTFADFVVAIVAAIIFRNVWALILGFLAGSITRCFVSYIIHSYRPKLSLKFSKAIELWGFGKWVAGSSILIFLITQGDDIFVGKLLGATALGFYQMAYRISNMPATEITHVISQVTFPTYSKLQDNLPKLREAYLKVLKVTVLLSFPIAGLIFILAPNITMIFLGEKWMPMVPAIQALAFWGLIRSISATTGVFFQAIGQPGIATRLQLAKLILLALMIYPFTMHLGILGTALAVVLSALFIDPLAVYIVFRIVGFNTRKITKMLIILVLCALIIFFSLTVLKELIPVVILPLFTVSIFPTTLIQEGDIII